MCLYMWGLWEALKKYADFGGRARRREFWTFTLANLLIMLILLSVRNSLAGFYLLAILLPTIAVGVRRLHDVGKSGWMLLIALIPIIGWVWLLVLLATDSEEENNSFGANPKGVAPITLDNPAQDCQEQSIDIHQSIDIDAPATCPHCKNPNEKKLRECEWCGGLISIFKVPETSKTIAAPASNSESDVFIPSKAPATSETPINTLDSELLVLLEKGKKKRAIELYKLATGASDNKASEYYIERLDFFRKHKYATEATWKYEQIQRERYRSRRRVGIFLVIVIIIVILAQL